MIGVAEAEALILKDCLLLPITAVPLELALGRVLREPVLADRDLPPFDRVTMDGIALAFDDWQAGRTKFEVIGQQRAGQLPLSPGISGQAIEIMTGAVCPPGLDTVVRREDLLFSEEKGKKWVEIQAKVLSKGQNIHEAGYDGRAGMVLLEEGQLLRAPEIGVLASAGYAKVRVSGVPRVALISTGDELVEVHQMPLPHQIRRSNVFALAAALSSVAACEVSLLHLPDEPQAMRDHLRPVLAGHDVLILSGGVSAGEADYVPRVLSDLGVQPVFHKVRQRPGKPFWFGRKEDKAVFGLPGNPVSTLLGFYRYVQAFLGQRLGLHPVAPAYARLSEDFTFAPQLTYFLPVWASSSPEGIYEARPFPGHGSGDYANLRWGNGFLELPEEQSYFPAGTVYRFWPF
ncbi:MAG: molybdopterin molybdotransferase MoeA [Microscillaceae bacterium]|nr:molybdopterin molybdotransferase MoeA [Microscillaceae bacterium]